MPYKEKEIEKRYRTIGEVADLIGERYNLIAPSGLNSFATSKIRFWEDEFFPYLTPKKRGVKNDRKYTKEDIERLDEVYQLMEVEQYTLKGARRQLEIKKGIRFYNLWANQKSREIRKLAKQRLTGRKPRKKKKNGNHQNSKNGTLHQYLLSPQRT